MPCDVRPKPHARTTNGGDNHRRVGANSYSVEPRVPRQAADRDARHLRNNAPAAPPALPAPGRGRCPTPPAPARPPSRPSRSGWRHTARTRQAALRASGLLRKEAPARRTLRGVRAGSATARRVARRHSNARRLSGAAIRQDEESRTRRSAARAGRCQNAAQIDRSGAPTDGRAERETERESDERDKPIQTLRPALGRRDVGPYSHRGADAGGRHAEISRPTTNSHDSVSASAIGA